MDKLQFLDEDNYLGKAVFSKTAASWITEKSLWFLGGDGLWCQEWKDARSFYWGAIVISGVGMWEVQSTVFRIIQTMGLLGRGRSFWEETVYSFWGKIFFLPLEGRKLIQLLGGGYSF